MAFSPDQERVAAVLREFGVYPEDLGADGEVWCGLVDALVGLQLAENYRRIQERTLVLSPADEEAVAELLAPRGGTDD